MNKSVSKILSIILSVVLAISLSAMTVSADRRAGGIKLHTDLTADTKVTAQLDVYINRHYTTWTVTFVRDNNGNYQTWVSNNLGRYSTETLKVSVGNREVANNSIFNRGNVNITNLNKALRIYFNDKLVAITRSDNGTSGGNFWNIWVGGSATTSSETSSVASSETSSVISSETSSAASSETSSVISSETSSVISSETSSAASSETSSVISSGTSSAASSETSSVISSETSSAASSETSSVISSETSSAASSETSSVISSETSSVISSETSSVASSIESSVPSSAPSSSAASSTVINIPTSSIPTTSIPEQSSAPVQIIISTPLSDLPSGGAVTNLLPFVAAFAALGLIWTLAASKKEEE